MNITTKDGRTFSGTALQIIKQMQSLAFGVDGFSTEQYIEFIVEQTKRFENVVLTVSGATDDERAESLIQELVRVELAESK